MENNMHNLLQSDGRTDETRRAEMERHVREELERWDSESSLGVASGRGISPGSADRHGPGIGTRSRPTSLHIVSNKNDVLLCYNINFIVHDIKN